jgi:ABC-2 family transporter
MYFQVSASRDADRRMVLAGLRPRWLVAARLLTGLILALAASVAALVTLWLRTGIGAPARVAAGTLMFAVIYLAIGAVIGALVRNAVNGTVLILFVWILDVFFGPALGSQDKPITRILPTHFVTLWTADLPLRHGGRLGDLGVAFVWVVGAAIASFAVVASTSRVRGRRRRGPRPGSRIDQIAASLRSAWYEWRRNPVLWVLLAVVPAVFILLSDAITPSRMSPMLVREGGRTVRQMVDVANTHGGTMAPIAVASLAALAGMFVVLDSYSGDRRLTLAGMRSGALLTSRFAIVALAAMVATGVSVAVAALVFTPDQWIVYAGANALTALTYGLIGMLIAPLFGRVAGVFVAFLLPFLDVGLAQSPMLRDQPATWAQYLPGYGSGRMLIDGAVTASFDETRPLLIGLGWLLALGVAAACLVRTRKTTR